MTPRWLLFVAGIACVLVGVLLVFRPFSSLAVLLVAAVIGLVVSGVGRLADDRTGRRRLWHAAMYLGAAVFVLSWPGPTIRILALVVGLALVVSGVLDLLELWSARGTAGWNAGVGGLASVVFGVLALGWPDVTVLVIAVVFGARVVILGVRLLVQALRREPAEVTRESTSAAGGARPGGWRLAGDMVGAAIAVVLLVISVGLDRAATSPTAFYAAPDADLFTPGRLLRSEPFRTAEIPADANAWRILYATTRDEGQPALASGIVVVPISAATTPAKVVAWAHGTTGASPGCAPSLLDQTFSAGAMFVQGKVIAAGWAIVATDYVGLGTAGPHPYLVGQPAGRNVLDAIRAAHQLSDVKLADDTVVWGHSQGGGAALWTGILAASYAPELKIEGVAALAPASNLPGMVQNLGQVRVEALFGSYMAEGYSSTYPDVRFDEYIRPGAQVIVREMAQRCLSDPGVLISVLQALLLDSPIWDGNPDRGALHNGCSRMSRSGGSRHRSWSGRGSTTRSSPLRLRTTTCSPDARRGTPSTTAGTPVATTCRSWRPTRPSSPSCSPGPRTVSRADRPRTHAGRPADSVNIFLRGDGGVDCRRRCRPRRARGEASWDVRNRLRAEGPYHLR